jgi:glutaredoxin
MDKLLLVYTMKGCPHCVDFKKMLDENKVDYYERDINIHEEEYGMFKEITENDFVPAFMIVENPDDEPFSHLFAPERDYNEIEEGIGIIKEHFNR